MVRERKNHMAKKWAVNELHEEEPVVFTEVQILESYWPYWYEKMAEVYGKGHPKITEENCIQDWVVSNLAWEVQ